MNHLEDIITSFEAEDRQDFEAFIQRNKRKKDRKDLRLFQLILAEGSEGTDLLTALDLPNTNAYHTLRKRLYKHVSEFVLIKSLEEDVTATSRVNSLFTLAKYLFQKGLNAPGWKLLLKAEALGEQHELYELLNAIYLLQIEYCHLQESKSLEALLEEYERNNERLKQAEKISMIQAGLKDRIKTAKREGRELSFEDIFMETLSDFKMLRLSKESPKILYALMSTLRQWVVASKEFHAFEPILERSYHALEPHDNPYYSVQLLLMLAHTKYRNKRFAESMDYLNQLNEVLSDTPVPFQRSTALKVNMLTAANLIFLGQLPRSIEILEGMMHQKMDDRQKGILITNLGIYHFYQHNYKRCKELLNTYEHTDNWYKKHLGLEWLLKRDLMAILLFNDAGDKDLAESKIRSVERKYQSLFAQPRYKRVLSFLGLIRLIVYKEGSIDMQALEQKVQVSFDWVPRKEEDLQAMIFYAWLRGKILKKTFYESMVDLITEVKEPMAVISEGQ